MKTLYSFGYAFKGIFTVARTQRNIQIQLLAATIVIALGIAYSVTITEWCILTFVITSVLVCEAFNTAIELLTDLVSPEFNPLAGRVKDVAAGAVLMAAMGAAIVGLLIFVPKLI